MTLYIKLYKNIEDLKYFCHYLSYLSVEPLLSADVIVLREDMLWLNLYSLEELPSSVLCLTILDLVLPVVLTVPRVDMVSLVTVMVDMSPVLPMVSLITDTDDMFLRTTCLCFTLFTLVTLWSLVSLFTLSPVQQGISLTVLLRHRE